MKSLKESILEGIARIARVCNKVSNESGKIWRRNPGARGTKQNLSTCIGMLRKALKQYKL